MQGERRRMRGGCRAMLRGGNGRTRGVDARRGKREADQSLYISTLASFVDLDMFSRCRRKPSGIRVSPGNLVGAGSEDKIQGECLSLTESVSFSFSLCLCQGRSGLETVWSHFRGDFVVDSSLILRFSVSKRVLFRLRI